MRPGPVPSHIRVLGRRYLDTAFNPDGEEMDNGNYEIVDRNTILFAGLHVDYMIDGDTIAFAVSPPESCTLESCRRELPRTPSCFFVSRHARSNE